MKILKNVALVLIASLLAAFFSEIGNKSTDEMPGVYAGTETEISYATFARGKSVLGNLPVSAKSAILCTDTGILLYEKNADVPLPMASITKVMTALVVLESVEDMTATVTVPPEAVGIEGSSVYLRAGETVTYETLLYALMLESANDAAVCLALTSAESYDSFVRKMNEKAAELSMTDTVFGNPHGLYEDGHYTTARDYAKLMSYALGSETFRHLISTKKRVEQTADKEMTRVMTNHNRLLSTYKYMIGGKTGYTKASGRTLVTAAEKNGVTLICVTLNASDDWNDHVSLYEAGFAVTRHEEISKEELSQNIPVGGGSVGSVVCRPENAVGVTMLEGQKTETEYFLPPFFFAPLKEGDVVGYVKISVDGKEYKKLPLYAESAVPARESADGLPFICGLKRLFAKKRMT